MSGLSERFVGEGAAQGSGEVDSFDIRDHESGRGFPLSPEAGASASACLEEDENGPMDPYGEGLKQKPSLTGKLLPNGSHHSPQVCTTSTTIA